MSQTRENKYKNKFNLAEYGILLALVVLWVIMTFTNEYFFTPDNIMNIFREASFVGIAAIGMTFVIMTRGIDLSVGGILSLCSVTAAVILPFVGVFWTVVITALLGGVCGAANGLLIVKLRIPPFIATLGTFFIFRSIAYQLSNAESIMISNAEYTNIGNGTFFAWQNFAGVPYPFVVLLVCTIIGTLMLRNMSFGRSILAIGNSERASYIAGIKVDKTVIAAYTILGACMGITAILLSSRLWAARAVMKVGYEFDIITVVVMGGCALMGGRGNIVSTCISAVFFVTISNAMNNYGVDPYWQYIIKGLILLFAFSMYNIRDLVSGALDKRRKTRGYRLRESQENM